MDDDGGGGSSSNDQQEVANEDFENAFSNLAHHLFPDGCPDDNLSKTWPHRNDRSSIPPNLAKSSFRSLHECARRQGLSTSQISCVAFAACSMVPLKERKSVRPRSPLVGDSSFYFCELLKCLLPTQQARIDSFVIENLLTVPCDSPGKASVFRFLTLAVRNGALVGRARTTLCSLYGLVLREMANGAACADAMRLLHAVTRRRHVRVDRAQRLRKWYDEAVSQKSTESRKRAGPIWLLLQLYARYDPQKCGKYFPAMKRTGTSLSKLFQIPDTSWEKEFSGEWQIDTAKAESDVPKQLLPTGGAVPEHSLSTALHWLEDAFDGIHSFSWGFVGGNKRRALMASDLLRDETLCQVMILSAQNQMTRVVPKDVSKTEVIRLRACLPYMLHEEWYHQGDSKQTEQEDGSVPKEDEDDGDSVHSNEEHNDSQEETPASRQSSRLVLLQSLSSMVARSDFILPEAELFLLEEILPQWDGSDRIGWVLCYELLPFLKPCTMSELHNNVLRHMERFLHYGSARVQSIIVAGFLTLLLRRWGRLDWSVVGVRGKRKRSANEDSASLKVRVLSALIQWVENELQRVFVLDAKEALRVAALDFLSASIDVAQSCCFLTTPSHHLVYNLLLSKTAVSIDRLCGLLLRLKVLINNLKSRNIPELDAELAERVSVFNCFIWDICSVLWREQTSLPSVDNSENNEARVRSILFTEVHPNTLRFLHENSDHLRKALSITSGVAFSGYVADFLREHPALSGKESLRGKVKTQYLDYLKRRGLVGVFDFLSTFVISLLGREKRRQRIS